GSIGLLDKPAVRCAVGCTAQQATTLGTAAKLFEGGPRKGFGAAVEEFPVDLLVDLLFPKCQALATDGVEHFAGESGAFGSQDFRHLTQDILQRVLRQ